MTLQKVTKAEGELIDTLLSVVGTIEEKNNQLKALGVYDGFARIYREYAASDDLEATKRAIFYFWYQMSEPPVFSGLADLPQDVSGKVFEKLEGLANTGNIDSELRWMLPYYYSITDWLFDELYKSSPALKRLLTNNMDSWETERRRENFLGRGLMGRYWSS